MNHSEHRVTAMLLALLVFVTTGVVYAANDADEALAVYRAYLDARGQAESITELYDYFPSRQVEQFSQLPAETLAQLGKSVLNPPNADRLRQPEGGFSLASFSRDGDKIELVLEAGSVSDGVRERLRRSVGMIKESTGWKVNDPRPRSWSAISRMPVEVPEQTPLREPGLAATNWNSGPASSAEDYRVVAEATIPTRNTANENKLRWDPRGQFVAIGDNAGMNFLSVPALEPIWSTAVQTKFAGGSISFDGAMLLADAGNTAIALPVSLNIDHETTERDYFFQQVDMSAIKNGLGYTPRFSSRIFSPSGPILALSGRGREAGVIVFQPTDQGDWPAEASGKGLTHWETPDEPTHPTWSASGERLAFISGYAKLGSQITVRDYPGGKKLQTLSREDIQPVHLKFSVDGRYLVSLGSDGQDRVAIVWDLGSGKVAAEMPGVKHAVFAPGGDYLLAVRDAGASISQGVADEIVIWKMGEAQPEASIPAFPMGDRKYPAAITTLGISPNGRYLAAVATSRDGDTVREIKLWEIGTGR